jgi:retron-type reverse transcriptase
VNAEQRTRLKQIGKDAFVREEMTRLGYWPPSPAVAEQAAGAEAALRPLYDELIRVRAELDAVNAEIMTVGDIPKLLDEIRRRRIERVRAARAVRKTEQEAARARKKEEDAAWRRAALPHLGRGVSAGLDFSGGDPVRLEKHGLPKFSSASDVARAIGISEPELAWLCYERVASSVDHYSRFTIPKKRGGVRVLSSPKRRLRVAQAWLLKTVLEPLPVHEAARAFRPGVSIVDNATPHQNKAVVVKVDLKDFFPSLGLRRVKGFFVHLGYSEGAATLFALLATETPRLAVTFDGKRRFVAVSKQRALPQGACTSPALTNLLCRALDARLSGAARSFGFSYTRYADDLTFSHESDKAPVGGLLTLVRKIIAEQNLTVNEEKTQVLRPSDRQNVTGLVVNAVNGSDDGVPRVSREDIRRFRAILHQCERDGFESVTQRLGRDALAYASGYLSFVRMSRPDVAERFAAAHPWLLRRG